VYHNSQLAGRTGSDGKIVLPSLAGYTSNQIRIDDRDIPIEIELDKVLKEVAPRSNAGVRVEFVSRTVAAIGGTLVVARDAGQQAVASAQLTVTRLDGESEPVQSSTDGQGGFYLDGLAPGRWRILAVNRTTRCSVELDINKSSVAFTDLGDTLCIPAR
jgi:outer membrane usher protein